MTSYGSGDDGPRLQLPHEELTDFLLTALDRATSYVVPRGGPLIPFAMYEGPEGPEGRSLHKFVEELVRAQELARLWVRHQAGLRMACVAWDGYVTLSGVRTDAVFVDGCDDSGEHGYVFLQRYVRAGRFSRSMKALGNAGLYARSGRLFD